MILLYHGVKHQALASANQKRKSNVMVDKFLNVV